MLKIKPIYFIIFFGIFISIVVADINLRKFDKNEQKSHLMIKGDILLIWEEAESFKKDIAKGKNFFLSGKEYTRTYLPSKIIAAYSSATKSDLFKDFEKKIINIGDKFIFLFLQIIFYYFCLYVLYKNLIKFYANNEITNYTILFLALEPTILQYHGTFWTESVYFSVQLLILSTIIKKDKTIYDFIIIGSLIGLMYYQKTVSIFLIFFIIIYFIFLKMNNKYVKISSIVFVYLIFLLFIGLNNFKRTGIFYILPIQTKEAHYIYLLPQIFEAKDNQNFQQFRNKNENKWKIENQYNEDIFLDYYKFSNFKKDLAFREILDNKLLTLKIYSKKIFHHSLLNPIQNYYWHEYNKKKYTTEYYSSDDKKKWIIWRIIYSFLIFFVVLIGLVGVFKSKNKIQFHTLLVLLIIYYILMLGWVGNNRYFMPSMILLSFFFGNGVNFINKIFKK